LPISFDNYFGKFSIKINFERKQFFCTQMNLNILSD
jgi:hypothetical protein